MRTVTSFSHHAVRVRPASPERTARLVRDASRVRLLVAEELAAARLARYNTRSSDADKQGTVEHVEEIEKTLGPRPAPLGRIHGVVLAYRRWCEEHFADGKSIGHTEREKYVPWVAGGPSLGEKFTRLEVQMIEYQERTQAKSKTVDDVVTGLFNGSRVLADAFRRDVLGRAKSLDLGAVSDADLAARLGDAYAAVRTARGGRTADDLPGPLDLLERYLAWLGERRDWRMTPRVLAVDSPAFVQFIREEASRHPRGLDPLTGRSG